MICYLNVYLIVIIITKSVESSEFMGIKLHKEIGSEIWNNGIFTRKFLKTIEHNSD